MYYFVGRMMVLQPDGEQTFVRGVPYHPMLPPGPGLYTLREPSLPAKVAAGARSGVAKLGAGGAAGAAKVPLPLSLLGLRPFEGVTMLSKDIWQYATDCLLMSSYSL